MNLLFAIDRAFIPLLLSCLHSISLRGGAEHYTACILHTDLTPTEQEQIKGATDSNITCCFYPVPRELFSGFPERKRYPVQIYYRLAAPYVLPREMERILYLDVDTVVINSLQELYDLDFEGKCLAACTHTRAFLSGFNRLRLGAESGSPYINTGVMLMNLPRLRQTLDLGDIRSYALKHPRRLWLPDQDILSALYGNQVKLVDTLRYNLSDRILARHNADPTELRIELDWVEENAVIIHYFGKNKPWKEHYHGILDVFYHRYGLPL